MIFKDKLSLNLKQLYIRRWLISLPLLIVIFLESFYEQTTLITKWALSKDSYIKQGQCQKFPLATVSMTPGYTFIRNKEKIEQKEHSSCPISYLY